MHSYSQDFLKTKFSDSGKSDSSGYGNREGEISQWESDGALDSSGDPGISEQSSPSGQSSTHCPAWDVKVQNPGLGGCQTQVGCPEYWFSPLPEKCLASHNQPT